ncbi:hypothetical protein C8R43DRAFT_956515 [Mycena crocata]|nr:hypothetical protein C8R43DRAFT_956511 [Mycena crocata]KAJ7133669.1 hypothetical protein C8R43DRAFT_956515 [Mycena crocata]
MRLLISSAPHRFPPRNTFEDNRIGSGAPSRFSVIPRTLLYCVDISLDGRGGGAMRRLGNFIIFSVLPRIGSRPLRQHRKFLFEFSGLSQAKAVADRAAHSAAPKKLFNFWISRDWDTSFGITLLIPNAAASAHCTEKIIHVSEVCYILCIPSLPSLTAFLKLYTLTTSILNLCELFLAASGPPARRAGPPNPIIFFAFRRPAFQVHLCSLESMLRQLPRVPTSGLTRQAVLRTSTLLNQHCSKH